MSQVKVTIPLLHFRMCVRAKPRPLTDLGLPARFEVGLMQATAPALGLGTASEAVTVACTPVTTTMLLPVCTQAKLGLARICAPCGGQANQASAALGACISCVCLAPN